MSILRCILPTCDQKKMRLVIAVFCALSTYRNPRLKSIFKDFSASVISVESCFVIRHCDQRPWNPEVGVPTVGVRGCIWRVIMRSSLVAFAALSCLVDSSTWLSAQSYRMLSSTHFTMVPFVAFFNRD